jgi:endogenous inhibitor of DNA gyrase (YacG/DUF329 family)
MGGDLKNVSPLRKPVECPNCAGPSAREAYPFSSKRCADVDLNRWFSGSYAVPAVESPEGDDGLPDELKDND